MKKLTHIYGPTIPANLEKSIQGASEQQLSHWVDEIVINNVPVEHVIH